MTDTGGTAPRHPGTQLSGKSDGAPENEQSEPQTEIIDKAVEIIRPLLRDPAAGPQAVRQVAAVVEMFRGPLPHPDHFQRYEEILPGSAHDIFEMAKREQKHRHRMNLFEMAYPYLGWFAGFVSFLVCAIGAVYLGLHGNTAIAALLLGVPCLGVIGWFINGRLTRPATPPPVTGGMNKNVKRKR